MSVWRPLCVKVKSDRTYLVVARLTVSSPVHNNYMVAELRPQVGCVRNKTSVSHISTEYEVISLDAGLRMDAIPALDLWASVIEGLHSSLNQPVHENLLPDKGQRKRTDAKTKKHSNRDDLELFTA